MKDWIQQNIDPPGMEKKNRGSLFSFIGRVFTIVKNDAETVFKAFFPYLCDPQKLREHGKSLSVPELPFDSEQEYRERVSSASFYLSRAGERSYIIEQMREHFGDRFVLKEEFLKVFIDIAELSEQDRIWVHGLLDSLLDPNIQLTVSEWFHYMDSMVMHEELSLKGVRKDRDSFAGSFTCNGQFYCDQGSELLCDGTWLCDGSLPAARFIPARGTISDYALEIIYADGRHKCDGFIDCSGREQMYAPVDFEGPITPSGGWGEVFTASLFLEPMADAMRINPMCDGRFLCDGGNLDAMADGPLVLRIIREFHCDGLHNPSCSVCDGSLVCDGSYQGYDGLYCSGDQIHEEVLW